MKKYQWVFFDLDGTLTDSAVGIINSVQYSLKKFGIDETDRDKLFKFIGPPLFDAYKAVFGFSDEDAHLAVKYYREYYPEHGIFENAVYDGIVQTLATLRAAGKKIVLATAKPETFAIRILDHFNLTEYFDDINGATFDGTRIRKDEVIAHALKKNDITDNSSVIMVGDRENDVSGARKHNIDCIGVLYGYGSLDELKDAGAGFIAETPEDICRIILKKNG